MVSEESLVEALSNQWLRGAVLDVFKEEPLPVDSPLWDLPTCTVTPHMSGSSVGDDAASVFVENVERLIDGRQLMYEYDWERKY